MAARKKAYAVVGAAAVLRTESGHERYLYRGAPVNEGEFAEESVKNAIAAGLVGEVTPGKPEATDDAAAKKAAADKAAADKAAADKAAADKAAADKAAADKAAADAAASK